MTANVCTLEHEHCGEPARDVVRLTSVFWSKMSWKCVYAILSCLLSSVGCFHIACVVIAGEKIHDRKMVRSIFEPIERTRKIEECACGIPQCPFTVIVRQLCGTQKCVRARGPANANRDRFHHPHPHPMHALSFSLNCAQ